MKPLRKVQVYDIEYNGYTGKVDKLSTYFEKLCQKYNVDPTEAASAILTARVRDIKNGTYNPARLLNALKTKWY